MNFYLKVENFVCEIDFTCIAKLNMFSFIFVYESKSLKSLSNCVVCFKS